jgi:hypothetical protein
VVLLLTADGVAAPAVNAKYRAKLMWWWCVLSVGAGEDSTPGVRHCLKEVAAEGVSGAGARRKTSGLSSLFPLTLPPYADIILCLSGVREDVGDIWIGEKQNPFPARNPPPPGEAPPSAAANRGAGITLYEDEDGDMPAPGSGKRNLRGLAMAL